MSELLEKMDNECEAEIAILPPDGNQDITDEEEINDESLVDVIPSEICGEFIVKNPNCVESYVAR